MRVFISLITLAINGSKGLITALKVTSRQINRISCILFYRLIFLGKNVRRRKKKLFLSFLLLFAFLVIISSVVPVTSQVEADLSVEQMLFTASGIEAQLFIERIPRIKEITLTGPLQLSLRGKITNASDSNLNGQGLLRVKLSKKSDFISISPSANSRTSSVEIREVRIQPGTTISRLSRPKTNTLSFKMTPEATNEGVLNNARLLLGRNPLQVSIETSSTLSSRILSKASEEPTFVDFVLEPEDFESVLQLNQEVDFYISTNDLEESHTWFQKRIRVSEAGFNYYSDTGQLSDRVQVSSVVKGLVRTANKNIEIEPNQFLMLSPPGLLVVRDIKFGAEQGLVVRASGKSNLIQVGLDPDFPIASIQSSLLVRYLPKEATSIIVAFSTAVGVSLFSWLLDDYKEGKK